MASQTSKSGLFAKYGNKLDAAVQKHAADETKYGIINLPAGISNGIARLVECKFDTYKSGPYQGEYYFRATGVVVSPESVTTPDGPAQVAGLQTSIMLPVCDTKNAAGDVTSQEENVERILNEMRKLGGQSFTDGASAADLESLAETLKDMQPFFRFTTSLGKVQTDPRTGKPKVNPSTGKPYEPRVWENWHGSKGLEDYQPEQTSGMADNSGPAPPPAPAPVNRIASAPKPNQTNGNGSHAAPASPAPAPTRGRGRPRKQPEPEPAPVPEFNEFEGGESADLDELLERCNANDQEAQNLLSDLAMKAGADEDAVTNAKSWEEVRDMAAGVAPAEEEPSDAPQVEQVYGYRPIDRKTGKPSPRAVDCEVTAVFPKAQTVTLKNLTNQKVVYTDVPWGQLIRDDS